MRLRHTIALLLVALQILTMALMTETKLLPLVFGCLLALTFLPYAPRPLSNHGRTVAYLLLALLFIAKANLFPLSVQAFSPLMSSTTSLGIAQFLIALQILHFAADKQKLPSYFPLLSIGALAFTGSIIDYGELYFGFGFAAFIACVLLLFDFMLSSTRTPLRAKSGTSGRYALRLAAMSVVIAMGLTVANLLRIYQEDLDLLFTRFVNMSGTTTEIGLGDLSRLHSVSHVRSRNEDRVAIRVVSEAPPSYLRARAFSTYNVNQWQVGVNRWRRDANPPTADDPDGGLHLFTVLKTRHDNVKRLEVWPAPKASGPLYAPLEAIAYRAASPQIVLDDHRIAEAPDFDAGNRFEVIVPLQPVEPLPHGSTLASCLAIPASVEPSVRALADELFADAHTPDEKIAAVMRYFSRYEYQLGIEIPRDRDPLTYFLIDRPPAHCEFFASGAAVLLRLGGIPSRYVTGFVPTEYNLFGQCWIARNKDAHAWTEAFVGNRGWVTVDATPGPGRPQHEEHSPFALAWDAARFRFHELFVLLRADIGEALQRFVIGVATLLIKVLVSTPFGWALAVVILAGLIALGRRFFRRRRPRRVTIAPPPPCRL